MEEKLLEGMKHLKTQRLLPVVGQSFLVCDTTPLHDDAKRPLIYVPPWLCSLLGLKDKTQMKGIKPVSVNIFIPYVILIIAVVISSAYPLLLHRLQGNFLQRLYIKYLCNAALLVPIVLIETQRKISGGGLSVSDALGLGHWSRTISTHCSLQFGTCTFASH